LSRRYIVGDFLNNLRDDLSLLDHPSFLFHKFALLDDVRVLLYEHRAFSPHHDQHEHAFDLHEFSSDLHSILALPRIVSCVHRDATRVEQVLHACLYHSLYEVASRTYILDSDLVHLPNIEIRSTNLFNGTQAELLLDRASLILCDLPSLLHVPKNSDPQEV
jgi:hypothetical protein